MKHDWAKFVGCYNFIVVMNEYGSFIEDIIKNIFIYIETMGKKSITHKMSATYVLGQGETKP
jgi:hypothetical protein